MSCKTMPVIINREMALAYLTLLRRQRIQMKTTLICWILLAIASTAPAQLGDSERTLNLQRLQPLFARARGKLLLLTVTNQPPELFSLLKPDPRPLRNR